MIFFSVYRFEILFYGRQISIPNAKGKKTAPELCDYELTWQNATFLVLISAPPSYAECVSGGASIVDEGDKETLGDTSFTPMYPFVNNYQFPSAPPPSFL